MSLLREQSYVTINRVNRDPITGIKAEVENMPQEGESNVSTVTYLVILVKDATHIEYLKYGSFNLMPNLSPIKQSTHSVRYSTWTVKENPRQVDVAGVFGNIYCLSNFSLYEISRLNRKRYWCSDRRYILCSTRQVLIFRIVSLM